MRVVSGKMAGGVTRAVRKVQIASPSPTVGMYEIRGHARLRQTQSIIVPSENTTAEIIDPRGTCPARNGINALHKPGAAHAHGAIEENRFARQLTREPLLKLRRRHVRSNAKRARDMTDVEFGAIANIQHEQLIGTVFKTSFELLRQH